MRLISRKSRLNPEETSALQEMNEYRHLLDKMSRLTEILSEAGDGPLKDKLLHWEKSFRTALFAMYHGKPVLTMNDSLTSVQTRELMLRKIARKYAEKILMQIQKTKKTAANYWRTRNNILITVRKSSELVYETMLLRTQSYKYEQLLKQKFSELEEIGNSLVHQDSKEMAIDLLCQIQQCIHDVLPVMNTVHGSMVIFRKLMVYEVKYPLTSQVAHENIYIIMRLIEEFEQQKVRVSQFPSQIDELLKLMVPLTRETKLEVPKQETIGPVQNTTSRTKLQVPTQQERVEFSSPVQNTTPLADVVSSLKLTQEASCQYRPSEAQSQPIAGDIMLW